MRVYVPHLQLKLKLWHDRHKQQWVDGKQLLDEVEHMLRQITHRGLSHHQHLIKELIDTTALGKQHTSGNKMGFTNKKMNKTYTHTDKRHLLRQCMFQWSAQSSLATSWPSHMLVYSGSTPTERWHYNPIVYTYLLA